MIWMLWPINLFFGYHFLNQFHFQFNQVVDEKKVQYKEKHTIYTKLYCPLHVVGRAYFCHANETEWLEVLVL